MHWSFWYFFFVLSGRALRTMYAQHDYSRNPHLRRWNRWGNRRVLGTRSRLRGHCCRARACPAPGGQTVDLRGAGRTVVERMGLLDLISARTVSQRGIAWVDSSGRHRAEMPVSAFGGEASFQLTRFSAATSGQFFTRRAVRA